MAQSSTEKSKALRERRAEAGQKEMRGIWLTPEEEKFIKPEVRAKLQKMRKGETVK